MRGIWRKSALPPSAERLDSTEKKLALERSAVRRTCTRERTRARARPFGLDSSFRRRPESRKSVGSWFRHLFDGCSVTAHKEPSTCTRTFTCTCTFTKAGHGGIQRSRRSYWIPACAGMTNQRTQQPLEPSTPWILYKISPIQFKIQNSKLKIALSLPASYYYPIYPLFLWFL